MQYLEAVAEGYLCDRCGSEPASIPFLQDVPLGLPERKAISYGKTPAQKKYNQPRFETGILVSGQLQMHFEGRSFGLSAGDSYSLRVDEAHFSINPSLDYPSVLVWTVTYL